MSFKKIIFASFCILSLSSSTQAELQFTLAPEIGVMSGTTEYELDIQFSFVDSTSSYVKYRLTSLLEFPLDVTTGGFSGILNSKEFPNLWSIELKYLTNFNDPGGKMIDSDWDEYSTQYPYTKWSETESNAEMDYTFLDLELRYRLTQKTSYDISLFAGGRYQKIYQDVVGLDGWQKQIDTLTNQYGAPIYFSGFANEVVGTYEIKLKQFKVGLQSDINLSDKVSSQLKIAFAPVFFEDIDDHVLRYKLSTADGNGKGIMTGLNLRYQKTSGLLSYIQLNSSYNYASSHGAQVQEWYGDDPGSPEDDTGDIISGIPHTIRTKIYSISLQLGLAL